MKTFRFRQNNSGGYYLGPDYFDVEAESVDHGWLVLEKQEWFSTTYCDCCGERWSKWNCEVLLSDGTWTFASWRD
jgi:hypothetical protein